MAHVVICTIYPAKPITSVWKQIIINSHLFCQCELNVGQKVMGSFLQREVHSKQNKKKA